MDNRDSISWRIGTLRQFEQYLPDGMHLAFARTISHLEHEIKHEHERRTNSIITAVSDYLSIEHELKATNTPHTQENEYGMATNRNSAKGWK